MLSGKGESSIERISLEGDEFPCPKQWVVDSMPTAERIHEHFLLKFDPVQVDMKLQVISPMTALLAIIQ